MKSVVGLMLILCVGFRASAMTISDQELDNDDLELQEREQQVEEDNSAKVKKIPTIDPKDCWRKCIRWESRKSGSVCLQWVTRCRHSEIVDQTGQSSEHEENQLPATDGGKTAELQSGPLMEKKSCIRVCVRWSAFSICLEWRLRCRRDEITNEIAQSPSNLIESADLQQWEGQPSEQVAVARRGRICLICARWSIFNICLICLQWGFKRTQLDVEERTAIDDGSTILDEQQTAIAMMESESVTAFRNLYDEKVVKAEIYEIPASYLGEDTTQGKTFGGVVITLTDGRRFVVLRGREIWNKQSSAILKAEDLTDVWKLTNSKDIQSSTVADFVKASDSSKSYTEAAEKMMALD